MSKTRKVIEEFAHLQKPNKKVIAEYAQKIVQVAKLEDLNPIDCFTQFLLDNLEKYRDLSEEELDKIIWFNNPICIYLWLCLMGEPNLNDINKDGISK